MYQGRPEDGFKVVLIQRESIGAILGLYWGFCRDNGQENESFYLMVYWGYIGVI